MSKKRNAEFECKVIASTIMNADPMRTGGLIAANVVFAEPIPKGDLFAAVMILENHQEQTKIVEVCDVNIQRI